MKKVIDGLRYDTQKATFVGAYSSPLSITDFNYWEAELYRTLRSKKFFIAGKGGPMSRFAQSTGQNEWTGGADIIPLTEQEARDWAERYLSPEKVEEFFVVQDA